MSVFISYAWEGAIHRSRVEGIVGWLKDAGHEVHWDKDLTAGDDIAAFMERGLRVSNCAIAICTDTYKQKADARETEPSGVGFESQILAASRLTPADRKRIIPVLLPGGSETSVPSYLKGLFYVDFREDTPEARQEVLRAVRKASGETFSRVDAAPAAAARGPADPRWQTRDFFWETPDPALADFEPIRIIRLINDEVTEPTNDGTRGSALYSVPFMLSARVPDTWKSLFVAAWRRPPQCTLVHRPSIARVEGNRLILDGTTIEEVEKYHLTTMKLCLDVANEKYAAHLESDELRRREEREAAEARRREIEDAAGRLRFD